MYDFRLRSIGVKADDIQFLKKILNDHVGIEVTNFKVQYKASVNGFGAKDFHKYCDNVSNLLVICQSKSLYLFGGFSVKCFESSEKRLIDDKSFIFTLLNPHSIPRTAFFPKPNGEAGPKAYSDRGPVYGGVNQGAIRIHDYSNKNGGISRHGQENSGYLDTTNCGNRLFTGHRDLEPLQEILALQIL